MTTVKFINKLIRDLFISFPEIEKCKHLFDELSNTHFISVPKAIYDLNSFADFDFNATQNAFDLGLQGMICFVTQESNIDFENAKTHINEFNNDVILKNLEHFIDVKKVYVGLIGNSRRSFTFLDVNNKYLELIERDKSIFFGLIKTKSTVEAGESNYAQAA